MVSVVRFGRSSEERRARLRPIGGAVCARARGRAGTLCRGRTGKRGQAAVESAIVLPMFVFMILGLMQLGLMQQAKIMTKYAAFRAARTGAILSAQHSAMERAALQALLPFVVKSGSGPSGGEHFISTFDETKYAAAWSTIRSEMSKPSPGELHYIDPNRGSGDPRTKRYLDVIICHRTTGMGGTEAPFDNPYRGQKGGQPFTAPDGQQFGAGGWGRLNEGLLAVQVSFYYRLPIPFVNRLLWHLAQGNELAVKTAFEVLRADANLGNNTTTGAAVSDDPGDREPLTVSHFYHLAETDKIYVIPLRASWAMTQNSDLLGRGEGANADYFVPLNPSDAYKDFMLPRSYNRKCVRPY